MKKLYSKPKGRRKTVIPPETLLDAVSTFDKTTAETRLWDLINNPKSPEPNRPLNLDEMFSELKAIKELRGKQDRPFIIICDRKQVRIQARRLGFDLVKDPDYDTYSLVPIKKSK